MRLGPSRFVLRPAALGDGADEAFAPSGPDLDLRTPLEQIARRDNLCRLAASGAAADPTLGLAVELRVGPSPNGAPPPGAVSSPPLTDGATIHPGDTLRIDVRNGGTRPLDVWLFLLDASYGVSVVFPAADATPRLAPGSAAPTIEGFVQDASLGEEHLLAIAVPADVAAPPVDLRWLEAPPLLAASARARSPSGGGALGDLLAAYAFPPRAGARTPSTLPAGPASVTMRTWTTAWGPVVPTPMPGTADLPGTDAAAATDDDPTTWFVGPRVFVGASGPGARGANLALSGGDLVEALGVAPAGDLLLLPRDGQGRYPFAAAPLPCALRLLPGRRIASYDTDLDHIHDLQLLDRDADGYADARRVRVPVGREGVVSAWSPWEPVHVPWLRASAVQGNGPDAAERLDRAIRALRWVAP